MSKSQEKIASDRQLLTAAQEKGMGATFGAFVRLSGPGWLQSAITLGGGSLAGALFLGVLGGTNLLWLQLVAIIMGVVMLSAISYVTLSTGERPFRAINTHINPVLGWGWIIATITANMIWCMPQFSLCFAALQKNLVGPELGDSMAIKVAISLNILMATAFIVVLQNRRGAAAKFFDIFLKLLVGTIVVCFVGVVVYMGIKGHLNWSGIFKGFVPDLKQWSTPTGELTAMLSQVTTEYRDFWESRIVQKQRDVMIGAAATAVGINMTFLMPYAMLNRGWDKPFRGLARFDLCTGLAIPYVLVTSCVVIAAAQSFHGKADAKFQSSDPTVMQESPAFNDDAKKAMSARVSKQIGEDKYKKLTESEQFALMAKLPVEEKRIVSQISTRSAFQLSQALAPLFGTDDDGNVSPGSQKAANVVFGLGIFGMGFSTIMILMLINGYAFSEMLGRPQGGSAHVIGCLVAGIAGASWPFVWESDSKIYLAIMVSAFGMMLLPIAYLTFFMMMNSKRLMGKEKPKGARMVIWNILMVVSVAGACAAAGTAIYDKSKNPQVGTAMLIVLASFGALVLVGFFLRPKHDKPEKETPKDEVAASPE